MVMVGMIELMLAADVPRCPDIGHVGAGRAGTGGTWRAPEQAKMLNKEVGELGEPGF
jgi:hypothetical protein